MAPYRLLPLTVALAVAGTSWADGDTVVLKPSADTTPAPGKPGKRQSPVLFDADHITGFGRDHLLAEGRVAASTGGESFEADRVKYDPQTNEITADGNVVLRQGKNRLECDALHLKITEQLGEAVPAHFYLVTQKGQPGRGDADKLVFDGPNQYQLDNARFTTCPANNDDWYLKSRALDLDYDRNVGTAHGVKLEYLGVPLLYTPSLTFALSDERKTGFLSPSMGISDKRGVEFVAPWYWNIAPNRDATITPRYMTRRGLQVAAEYRYLEPSYRGSLVVEALPRDNQTGTGRYREIINHAQQFSPRLYGYVHAEDVSDDRYFSDLSSLAAETSTQNLPREAGLAYNGEWWNVKGRVQSYQTLQDPAAPVTPPYRRMPQILANATRNDLFGKNLNLNFNGELVRFETDQTTQVNGNRLHLNPSLSMNFEQTFGYLRPKIGWDYTLYQLDSNSTYPTSTSRSLPIVSLDSGMYLDKTLNWRGNGYTQTLEPRLYYVWIPYRDQSGIPVFDTSLSDPLQPQLFTENQFIGIDRINDANQLTLGVTSRFVETESGKERLQVTLGQRYYFNDQKVTLPGYAARASKVSNLLGQASGQITDRWYLTSGIQYNTDNTEIAQANAGGSYRAGHGRLINLDFRYTNPLYASEVKQADISWQWPINAGWYSLGRVNYSIYDHRLVEGLVGFEYNAGCWTTRFVAQRLVTSAQNTSTTFYVQLELGGLTRLGPNPLDVLKNSIPGYTKSDEL